MTNVCARSLGYSGYFRLMLYNQENHLTRQFPPLLLRKPHLHNHVLPVIFPYGQNSGKCICCRIPEWNKSLIASLSNHPDKAFFQKKVRNILVHNFAYSQTTLFSTSNIVLFLSPLICGPVNRVNDRQHLLY